MNFICGKVHVKWHIFAALYSVNDWKQQEASILGLQIRVGKLANTESVSNDCQLSPKINRTRSQRSTLQICWPLRNSHKFATSKKMDISNTDRCGLSSYPARNTESQSLMFKNLTGNLSVWNKGLLLPLKPLLRKIGYFPKHLKSFRPKSNCSYQLPASLWTDKIENN
jgi:hypothetical protein